MGTITAQFKHNVKENGYMKITSLKLLLLFNDQHRTALGKLSLRTVLLIVALSPLQKSSLSGRHDQQ